MTRMAVLPPPASLLAFYLYRPESCTRHSFLPSVDGGERCGWCGVQQKELSQQELTIYYAQQAVHDAAEAETKGKHSAAS
eukprot:g7658.t1